jgi:hypothetical protein
MYDFILITWTPFTYTTSLRPFSYIEPIRFYNFKKKKKLFGSKKGLRSPETSATSKMIFHPWSNLIFRSSRLCPLGRQKFLGVGLKPPLEIDF